MKGGPGPRPESGAAWRHMQNGICQLGSPLWMGRAWWGWPLPEASTQPPVIKAISHLPTRELQAGAAAAGTAWGFVLCGRAGSPLSGRRFGGLEIKDCPPFWPQLRWCLDSEAQLAAGDSSRSFLHKGLISSFPWAENLKLAKCPQKMPSVSSRILFPLLSPKVSIHRAWSGDAKGFPSC